MALLTAIHLESYKNSLLRFQPDRTWTASIQITPTHQLGTPLTHVTWNNFDYIFDISKSTTQHNNNQIHLKYG